MKDNFLPPFDFDKKIETDSDTWLLYASISVFIAYFLSIVYMHLFAVFSADYNISTFFRILNSAMSLHFLLISGIIFSYCSCSVSKDWQKDFFFKQWKPLYILEAVGLEIGLFIPLGILAFCSLKIIQLLKKVLGPDFAQYLDTTPHFKEYLLKMDWSGFALIAVVAVIFAPTIEEIVFRRVIYGFLSSRIGMVAALIITSAVFAGIHLRLVDFSTLFVLGIIWQIQFIYHKSLYPSILYHTFHNALAMGLLFCIKYFNLSINM